MAKKLAVIGLGHFGSQLATELSRMGAEVLAIDDDMDRLDDIKDKVTHSVRLDATELKPLQSQGLDEFDAVIIGIGDNFEATLLVTAVLQQIGVKRIIVRATTPVHERILNHLGINEVILPSAEAAERLATSLMFEKVVDSFALSTDFTIVEVSAPESYVGKTLEELQLPRRLELSVITIKRTRTTPRLFGISKKTTEEIVGIPKPDTVVERGDILVVFGAKSALQRMLEL